MKRSEFTVEFMIVIVIVGILVAIAIPKFEIAGAKAKYCEEFKSGTPECEQCEKEFEILYKQSGNNLKAMEGLTYTGKVLQHPTKLPEPRIDTKPERVEPKPTEPEISQATVIAEGSLMFTNCDVPTILNYIANYQEESGYKYIKEVKDVEGNWVVTLSRY